MKAAATLAASGHRSVINISSVFGAGGGFGTSPAYHAAKGAVRTLTKNIALHSAGRGGAGELGASWIHVQGFGTGQGVHAAVNRHGEPITEPGGRYMPCA